MTTTGTPPPFDPSWKQVATYLARAEREYGLVRKQVAAALGVTSPALSAWSTDNAQSKISMDKLRPFAHATRMTQDELARLVVTRLQEKDGTKLQLDADLLADAIWCLLPSPEEQHVLDVYNDTCGAITFSIFSQTKYRERLAAAMTAIVSEAVTDHIEEGQSN